jgi:hypothetical protein
MKKYLRTFTFTFLPICVLISLLNLIVDPFWYYRIIEIPGFNQVKSKFQFYEREYKPLILDKENPQAIILGSSYSEIGLDPMHPALTKNGFKTYNFGMINAEWNVIYCNFHFAIQRNPIRKIILGINVVDLSEINCSNKIESMGQPNHFKNLFSLDATLQSIKVLTRQGPHEATHTREGLFLYTKRQTTTRNSFKINLKKGRCRSLNNKSNPQENIKSLNMEGLRDVIRNVLARNISLKIIINPRHAYDYENIIRCGNIIKHWKNLYQVVEVLEKETSQNPNSIELWDFNGYNKFMAQRVSPAPDIPYWQDPRHYNFEIGNFFLDRMYGIKSSDEQEVKNLGARITTKNLYKQMEKIRKERERFIKKNPWFLLEYESLTE